MPGQYLLLCHPGLMQPDFRAGKWQHEIGEKLIYAHDEGGQGAEAPFLVTPRKAKPTNVTRL